MNKIKIFVCFRNGNVFTYEVENAVKAREHVEADPLFQQFIKAIAIDAMMHPEKLHDAKDVWDDEWSDLLEGLKDEEE